MHVIDDIIATHFDMCTDEMLRKSAVLPVSGVHTVDNFRRPVRLSALSMKPHIDTFVELLRKPNLCFRKVRHFVGIRNSGTLPIIATEAPAVEGALDAVSDHATSDPEIGTVVRTVTVDNVHDAVFATKDGDILSQDSERFYFSDLKKTNRNRKANGNTSFCGGRIHTCTTPNSFVTASSNLNTSKTVLEQNCTAFSVRVYHSGRQQEIEVCRTFKSTDMPGALSFTNDMKSKR